MSIVSEAIKELHAKEAERAAKLGDIKVQRDQERQARDEAKQEFLQRTRAVPTPAVVYALWLKTFIEQGGKIRYARSTNYTEPMVTIEGNFNVYEKWMPRIWPKYEFESAGRWHTKPISIPSGYGADAMKIMIVEDFVESNLERTSRSFARPHEVDTRPGWEWGHTQVFTLRRKRRSRFSAWTNQPDSVDLFPDIEELLLKRDSEELVRGMVASFEM